LTHHWLVDKWVSNQYFDLRYDHIAGFLLLGGGINYTKNNAEWFRGYYGSNRNTISNLSTFMQIGHTNNKSFLRRNVYLRLGYTALLTDIDIYNGEKSGFYSALGLEYAVNVSDRLDLGFGINYGISLIELDFEYNGGVTLDFAMLIDDFIRTISPYLSLQFRL
jgi:hypothetical protein